MSDDWEYSDNDCPKCSSQMATRICTACGGDGYFEDEEDECVGLCDERCDHCNGDGHETWCRECGWDMNFKCFLSAECERAFNEKQSSVTPAKVETNADEFVRSVIKHVSDSAIELAIMRHSLCDIEGDEPDRETIEGIKSDTVDCLTGDETGCNDPSDLNEINCELLWLKAQLNAYSPARDAAIAKVVKAAKAIADQMEQLSDDEHVVGCEPLIRTVREAVAAYESQMGKQ